MTLVRVSLIDFRNYTHAEFEPAERLTVIEGDNGEGKSNLLEAVAYLATLSSFRGAPREVLVRQGCARAVLRAVVERQGRRLLLEVELSQTGPDRIFVNRQPLRRGRDLLGALRVTVFSPDDLVLIKGGPVERRRYLDDLLVSLHPKYDKLRIDLDRVLRQRNALLRDAAAGRMRRRSEVNTDLELTLDVWDSRLAEVGERLASARLDLVERLEPLIGKAYNQLAPQPAEVRVEYESSWREAGLRAALTAVREEEFRRGITLVGPHRDDLALALGERASRTHASQGEQRCLALALRLAAQLLVTEATGTPPVLLLDDVFSELDVGRGEGLLAHLPHAQTLITTAGALPPAARPQHRVRVVRGRLW